MIIFINDMQNSHSRFSVRFRLNVSIILIQLKQNLLLFSSRCFLNKENINPKSNAQNTHRSRYCYAIGIRMRQRMTDSTIVLLAVSCDKSIRLSFISMNALTYVPIKCAQHIFAVALFYFKFRARNVLHRNELTADKLRFFFYSRTNMLCWKLRMFLKDKQ